MSDEWTPVEDDDEYGGEWDGELTEAELEAAVLAEFAEELEEIQDLEQLPVLAIIGRPNVGKSTLVNRIIGRREAVVQDVPGVTRDRVTYEAEWNGEKFLVMDTGGWQRDAKGIAAQIAAQAERAVAEADAVLFIVDATVGETDADTEVVKVLRKSGKPVLLVANKVDDERTELELGSLWSMGLGEPFGVSALHGRNSGDLLDKVLQLLPADGTGVAKLRGPKRIALLGKPNVGKSSLLNKLAGEARVVVDSVAGTTVDPVDELIVLGDETFWFIDTAGIRRRVRESSGHEFYASLRTQSALDRAEVAVMLIDASQPLAEQDVRIINMVVESGRALVLAFNKWDLLDEDRRTYLEREIEKDLGQVAWAPRVNISAQTGRHMEKLVPAINDAYDGWTTRVPTGRLNTFFTELVAAHPHPVRGGKQPRVLFGTQASVAPPTFVLFTSGFLEAGYRRFIERRLREEFGFTGSPIRISMRVRSKRGSK